MHAEDTKTEHHHKKRNLHVMEYTVFVIGNTGSIDTTVRPDWQDIFKDSVVHVAMDLGAIAVVTTFSEPALATICIEHDLHLTYAKKRTSSPMEAAISA